MRHILIATLALAATPALSDIETRNAEGSVVEVMDRLETAVEEAGATIFARIDHGAGASDAGLDLPESELLIFGNPKLGTPVMQEDIEAGLFLPLKMLVYSDGDGQTRVAYEEIGDTFDDLDMGDDLEALGRMEDAMRNFADAASGSG
ncbi:uncharacterized protein (DUF302 family) [Palleronia aestuarii]|uniref:Uncharacterized protein (DUF302 family) n=1 Tax=Palleronia aestuarii TaxID=568105 RepID=A0A2W7NM04_9RHOB|nr:DUF302 domain-containing protein [Palleronia aestuarii]PZX17674.1 uncharacterized protein (DUF302 family) [Palleronia aestuarii]